MAFDFGSFVLGGNVFGWTVPRDQSFALLDAFVDAGGRSIDTADVYAAWIPGNQGGESETILGEWLAARGHRQRLLLATKVAKWSERPGLSAANIEAAVEGSLKRLRTDCIDLYYAHEDDEKVDPSEYVQAFDKLVRAGKVRALGASNFTAARLSQALSIAEQGSLARFEYAQDHYNLVERDFERTLQPTLLEHGVRELPYWALASGFLTGKYRPGQPVESARAGAAAQYLDAPQNLRLLEALDQLAAQHKVSVTAIALAWLRAQPSVAAPIASARTKEQLDALFESARVQLSPTEVAQLSAITA